MLDLLLGVIWRNALPPRRPYCSTTHSVFGEQGIQTGLPNCAYHIGFETWPRHTDDLKFGTCRYLAGARLLNNDSGYAYDVSYRTFAIGPTHKHDIQGEAVLEFGLGLGF